MTNKEQRAFAAKAIDFFLNLDIPGNLPEGIEIMDPYKSAEVQDVVIRFFNKFFDDKKRRTFLVGINPGRFGGGLTGIAFTSPVSLAEHCGIENDIEKKRELSAKFVYKFINEYGGADKFYSNYFITALYPQALIKNGKNHNYYDSKKLYEVLKPTITSMLRKQIEFGAKDDYVICLGRKNAKYLEDINNELKFFKRIIPVDHPRFIMQYKSKQIDNYIKMYMDALKGINR